MNRENDVGFMIKQIHDDLGRYLNQRLKSEGITSAQAEVLHFVGARAGCGGVFRCVPPHGGGAGASAV